MSRTLVVGFDGAVLELCERWIADGRMPTLASVFADGSYGPLRSTAPFNSAVAWTTLATGTNPGRHGIYDFVLPRKGGYGYRVATRNDRLVPALWTYASAAGARVGIVNIPMTFPAEPVDDFMISGMDAPSLEHRAVHPPTLLKRIRSSTGSYRIMSKAPHAAERGDFALAERELVEVMRTRAEVVCALAEGSDLALVMVNLEATDGSHHLFWEHHDPAHPRHDPSLRGDFGDAIGRVYEATDRALRGLIDAFRPDTVLVVSDHGGGPTNDWVFFLNDWLVHEGFLSLLPSAAASFGQRLYQQAKLRLSVPARQALRPLLGGVIDRAKGAALYGDYDWARSKAYGHMQPAVRLNLAGREPQGIVHDGDRQQVLKALAERAAALTFPSGEPVVTAVHFADDVYEGGAAGGPDLILELTPGLHIRSRNTTGERGFLRRVSDLGLYFPSGVHTGVGMVAACGTGIERRGRVSESSIEQVCASVLSLMNVPAPELDGEPFGFVSAPLRRTGAMPHSEGPTRTDLDPAEEAEVLDRLRGLGYVD